MHENVLHWCCMTILIHHVSNMPRKCKAVCGGYWINDDSVQFTLLSGHQQTKKVVNNSQPYELLPCPKKTAERGILFCFCLSNKMIKYVSNRCNIGRFRKKAFLVSGGVSSIHHIGRRHSIVKDYSVRPKEVL